MKEMQLTNSKPTFFTAIGIVGIAAVLIGFLKTFIIPVLSGTKTWPFSIYLHASFVFCWLVIFLTQSVLIQNHKYTTHITIGKLATIVAVGASISIIPAALYQCKRELGEGLGQIAISSILGSFNSACIFLLLVAFAIGYRKKPQAHKRFMLLATIVLIWPAWFRWRHYFPTIKRPDIWFAVVLADSLIIIAFIWDWLKNKSIHPSLLFAGLFIMAEHCIEIIFFDSSGWRIIANSIYNTFK